MYRLGLTVGRFPRFFVGGGGEGALTNIQVFGFIFVIFTQFTQKCIANDICDGGREGGAHFFTFPPAGSTNKRVGKVTRLSYPITYGIQY